MIMEKVRDNKKSQVGVLRLTVSGGCFKKTLLQKAD